MGQLIYFQHACKRYQVYSLDPTSDLIIEVFGVHLLPELVVLSRFQAAKFEAYDNNNISVGLLPKATKSGNFY